MILFFSWCIWAQYVISGFFVIFRELMWFLGIFHNLILIYQWPKSLLFAGDVLRNFCQCHDVNQVWVKSIARRHAKFGVTGWKLRAFKVQRTIHRKAGPTWNSDFAQTLPKVLDIILIAFVVSTRTTFIFGSTPSEHSTRSYGRLKIREEIQ